ncbi:MAG TPA: bifunctional proline dehydrogenase/L-glutamate gamma-semialdehyde dehydrogenase [Solirubrobacteraceae bacterium]|jgi:RHH-type proline utilization regulon transcriptional repressor/proline dehydrogenase/delta 1-pyrroline-5-carboxylate dehydrogenase|nr:bifunctional proline dehydrogenase/L-glutamate gamma-semialdehyde dehydrogenase [Solirubrobacteraceae bacterium]
MTFDRTDDDELIARTEALAQSLLIEAVGRRRWRERMQGERVARLLRDEQGLAFVLALTDEVLRIRDARRAAEYFKALVTENQSPRFLGPVDRQLLRIGAALAVRYPRVIMPLVKARVRAELSSFIVAAESRPFARHVRRRTETGTKLNINLLGEEILGDEEAEHRLQAVLALLRRPDVDYVSVKVSAVCSQLNIAAFEHEVDRVAGQIRRLYDEALAHSPAKFVNLDMEAYQDLELTLAVFRRVLGEERYGSLDAGIVLQAYIPDSFAALDDLLQWARWRHERWGGRIKVRIVKGANLATEQVQAEVAGLPQAPFTDKADVDANYKRMLDSVLDPANAASVRVGVATHNLFEAAWALTLSAERGLRDMVELEMLEGMAPSIAAAVQERAGGLLLYTPIARRADSESVIAYLIRRFQENAGPENFLHHQFDLLPGTSVWQGERERFRAAVRERHLEPVRTRRTQDRGREMDGDARGHERTERFRNEPDTDIAVTANRAWIAQHMRPLAELGVELVPVVAAGRTVRDGTVANGEDPAVPDQVAYRWVQADEALVDAAVATAADGGERWRALPLAERHALLHRVADGLAANRGRLLGVMAREAGKTFAEGDAEVSEVIDLARYYADSIPGVDDPSDAERFEPYRTVAVVPPWNFPLAIPGGGVFAALAAGAAVIFKPAPETVASAWLIAEIAWAAGIPQDALQFVPTADGDAGRRLVTHDRVDAIVFTGSWDTARLFLGWRPDMRLHAETSGKNAVVVTAAADLDAAVTDIVRSAFGHAGQKCSAASLAILEASVYDDRRFMRQLADAVGSLRPGPGWALPSTMGPVIRAPEGPLSDALNRLEPGERWLVKPRMLDGNPRLWSPGVKLGVNPGSPFHLTECFGPVLGLMRAADLDEAITLQNQPAYGLTAGLQSLDPAEIAIWRERVQAGNLYVNRHITGAIVRRQPFGGWKRSVIGPAAKAGGPNYVASLGTWAGNFTGSATEFEAATARHARRHMTPRDDTGLLAEANVFRYRPLQRVLLRAGADVDDRTVELALAAARAFGTAVTLSSPVPRDLPVAVTVEDETVLARRLDATDVEKLRLLGEAGPDLRLAVYESSPWLDDVAVVADPGREALRWVREQAVSETRHRHGNITDRRPGLVPAQRDEVGVPPVSSAQ